MQIKERNYCAEGGAGADFSDTELEGFFADALAAFKADLGGDGGKALVLPPDISRFHSRAGFFTSLACRKLGDKTAVMPALGTHMAMTAAENERMFPGVPAEAFRVHDWRRDVVTLGRLPASFVEKAGGGVVSYEYPVQVNRLLTEGGFSFILSIGQVVPHEVIGMANHAKNLFVGTGGKEAIDKSHFLGACYGMEKMMGRADTPVRALFDEGFARFGGEIPPVLWVLTVIGSRPDGSTAVRGLFIGTGRDCFTKAAALSAEVNVDLLDSSIDKAVVYLDPSEFRTTWIGNKAIYRTRMAMATGGELVILAPGLEKFGEDPGMDLLIRKYGYRSGREIRALAEANEDLGGNLSAAAHLIHGSSEGRFTVRYCPGPGVGREAIESVGFTYGDLDEMLAKYKPEKLNMGFNEVNGEKIFYVPNPALGLWAEKRRFKGEE